MSLTLAEINSKPSLKPSLDWLEDDKEQNLPVLPVEIINKILFEFGGYQTPTATIIKQSFFNLKNYNLKDYIKGITYDVEYTRMLCDIPWVRREIEGFNVRACRRGLKHILLNNIIFC